MSLLWIDYHSFTGYNSGMIWLSKGCRFPKWSKPVQNGSENFKVQIRDSESVKSVSRVCRQLKIPDCCNNVPAEKQEMFTCNYFLS